MASGSFKLKGVDKFMRNFNKEIRDMRGRTLRGLIEAAIVLQRAAEPGTPIDTGNLRSSFFIVTLTGGRESQRPVFKGEEASDMKRDHEQVTAEAAALAQQLGSEKEPIVVFGYSANYAVFVHENVDASFKRPGAHARWLYAALQRKRPEMLETIREHASF